VLPLLKAVLPRRERETAAFCSDDLASLLKGLEGVVDVVSGLGNDHPERRVVDPLVVISELCPHLLKVDLLGIDIVVIEIGLFLELSLAFTSSRLGIPSGPGPTLLETTEPLDRPIGEFDSHLESTRVTVSLEEGNMGLPREILRVVFISSNVPRLQQGTTVVAGLVDT